MSSFALEVVSIFVSTVTGTVLLSHGAQVTKKMVGYVAPLELLHHHHEFEYLRQQQGLWRPTYCSLTREGFDSKIGWDL